MIDKDTAEEIIQSLDNAIDNASDLLHITKIQDNKFKQMMIDVLERELADYHRIKNKLINSLQDEAA